MSTYSSDIVFSNRIPTPEDYNSLRLRSGMSTHQADPERVRRAFAGSAFIVSAWLQDELIGFGRIVADGGICYNVNDIMVDKKYQRQGIADRIMTELDVYLDRECDEYSFVALLARIPADHIYHRHRFEYIDPARRFGMLRHQDDRPTRQYSPI